MKRVGPVYHKFLEEKLKKWEYAKNLDGFNMSLCSLQDIGNYTIRDFVACIRITFPVPAFFGDEVIPGNFSTKENYMRTCLHKQGIDPDSIKYGKNFIWNSWGEPGIMDNFAFFLVSYADGNFKVNEKIAPIAFSNLPLFYKGNIVKVSNYNDIRMFRHGDRILFYDGFISAIYELVIRDSRIYTSIEMDFKLPVYKSVKFYFNKGFCDNIRSFDKNWAFIEDTKAEFIFLNWFEEKAVTITVMPIDNKNKECAKKPILLMKKDAISGTDEKMELGMFSFGTPFAAISKSADNFEGISVGHIKLVRTSEKYTGKRKEFCEKIAGMEKSADFISLSTYYYLLYFIHLERKKDKYSIRISDAYLYIPAKKEKYTFSINFPMSINKISNSRVIVSLGVGDFYTYIFEKDISEIKNLCRHDLEKFDISAFNYNVEEF